MHTATHALRLFSVTDVGVSEATKPGRRAGHPASYSTHDSWLSPAFLPPTTPAAGALLSGQRARGPIAVLKFRYKGR